MESEDDKRMGRSIREMWGTQRQYKDDTKEICGLKNMEEGKIKGYEWWNGNVV